MKTLLIDGFSKITKEGLTIHFNQKFALNRGLATDEWYVSWDKIGKALCGNAYCEETEVAELNKIRKAISHSAEVKPEIINAETFRRIKRDEDKYLIGRGNKQSKGFSNRT